MSFRFYDGPMQERPNEENLRFALELFAAAEDLLRLNLRREERLTEEEIEQRVDAWIRARPGAADGDAPGRARPLDRT